MAFIYEATGSIGVIEDEDENGNRVYLPSCEQIEKQQQQALLQKLQMENAALSEQLAQSDEAAITLFEAKTAQEAINSQQDEAILQIYEKIGGTKV